MDARELERILRANRDGEISVDEAREQLHALARVDLGFATVDGSRAERCGFPEVVFCEGKTDEEAIAVSREILRRERKLLATRARRSIADALAEEFPEIEYDERARVVYGRLDPAPAPHGLVLVLSAGTADGDVAREAARTLELMDARVESITDVGVAGLHRLLAHRDRLRQASVVVVVAGMEGALPSVVGGLVDCPVVAVPTSVGYGASLGGVAALLTMLNSCAAGITVVNIDNGFGGGYAAGLINRVSLRVDVGPDGCEPNRASGATSGNP